MNKIITKINTFSNNMTAPADEPESGQIVSEPGDTDKDAGDDSQEWVDERDYNSEEEFARMLQDFIDAEIGKKQEEGGTDGDSNDSNDDDDDEELEKTVPKLTVAEMFAKLTGLGKVREHLEAYHKLVQFNNLRRECDLPVLSTPLHAMFLGSPGTGKTTVARMMGRMLANAGMLSSGHVVVRERATLLGQYYSSESTNTREAIDAAQGGILFIDEAHQLYQPSDPKDPGKFVIETLLTALADENKRDWMLILAGYPDEMRRLFELNPGLKSRIPDSNIYIFDDYTVDELMTIAENYLTDNTFGLTPEAHDALRRRLEADYECRDKTFGNARHVMNLIQTEIIPAMAARVIEESLEKDVFSPCVIEASDIPAPLPDTRDKKPRIGFRA